MANSPRISNAAAIAACDAIVDLIDGDTPPGLLRIYDGTQATDPDTAVAAQVLLAELTFSNPAFGNAADDTPGGIATASAITDDSSANATGTASWFRIVTGTAFTAVLDGSVGTSSVDLTLNTASITSGDIVSVTSFTVTMPES
jgi:hypothetical protein